MNSTCLKIVGGLIALVVGVSVVIGLNSPDGSVGDEANSPAASPVPSPAPSTKAAAEPRAERPSASSAERPSAGRPSAGRAPASVKAKGDVDWCSAVKVSGAEEATAVFGAKAVDAAACAAVRFVFDRRYSRLSLPRDSYRPEDFTAAAAALTESTAQTFGDRAAALIASPSSRSAADALGLLILRNQGTVDGHASAGQGRLFYGPANSTRGYKGRSVWINQTWSTVAIRVDHAKSEPRIVATLDASAAVPVFDPSSRTDHMMTVPTTATFTLRPDGKNWLISGWTQMTTKPASFAPLKVR